MLAGAEKVDHQIHTAGAKGVVRVTVGDVQDVQVQPQRRNHLFVHLKHFGILVRHDVQGVLGQVGQVVVQVKISVDEVFKDDLPGKLAGSDPVRDLVAAQLIHPHKIHIEGVVQVAVQVGAVMRAGVGLAGVHNAVLNVGTIAAGAYQLAGGDVLVREFSGANGQLVAAPGAAQQRQRTDGNPGGAAAGAGRYAVLDLLVNLLLHVLQSHDFGADLAVLFPQQAHIGLLGGRLHPVGGALQVNDAANLAQLEAKRLQMLDHCQNFLFLGGKLELRAFFLRDQKPNGNIITNSFDADVVLLCQCADQHAAHPHFCL